MKTLLCKNQVSICQFQLRIGHQISSHVLSLLNKVFIQASGLACEVCVEVSLLRSLPTTVCETANSVVCQVAMLPAFNSL